MPSGDELRRGANTLLNRTSQVHGRDGPRVSEVHDSKETHVECLSQFDTDHPQTGSGAAP